ASCRSRCAILRTWRSPTARSWRETSRLSLPSASSRSRPRISFPKVGPLWENELIGWVLPMIELRIEDDQGNEIRRQVFEDNEVLIGRARGNQISLQSSTVSSKHARLYRDN